MNKQGKIISLALAFAAFGTSLAEDTPYSAPQEGVFYWGISGANGKLLTDNGTWFTWAPSEEVEGGVYSAVATPNLTNGTAIIDRKPGDTNGSPAQNATGTSAIKIDTLYNTNATAWHLYFATSGYSFEVKNLIQDSSGIFKLRSAGASTGTAFTSTGKVEVLKGTLLLGVDAAGADSGTSAMGLNRVSMNNLLVNDGASATIGVFSSAKVENLEINQVSASKTTTKVYILNATESSGTKVRGTADVTLGTVKLASNGGASLYLGDSTAGGALKSLSIDDLQVSTSVNPDGGSGAVYINTGNYVAGTSNLENPDEGATGLILKKITLSNSGQADVVFNTMTEAVIRQIEVNMDTTSGVNTLLRMGGTGLSTLTIEDFLFTQAISTNVSKFANIAFNLPDYTFETSIGTFRIASTTSAGSNVRLSASSTGIINIDTLSNEAGSKGGLLLNSSSSPTSLKIGEVAFVGDDVSAENTVFNLVGETTGVNNVTVDESVSLEDGMTANFGSASVLLNSFKALDVSLTGASVLGVYAKTSEVTNAFMSAGASTASFGGIGSKLTDATFGRVNVSGKSFLNVYASTAGVSETFTLADSTANLGNSATDSYIGTLTLKDSSITSGSTLNVFANTVNSTGSFHLSGSTATFGTKGTRLNNASLNFNSLTLSSTSSLTAYYLAMNVSGNISLTGASTLSLGTVSTETGSPTAYLNNLNINNISVSDGSKAYVHAANMKMTGTANISGTGTTVLWMSGTNVVSITDPLGYYAVLKTINLSDRASLTMRRLYNGASFYVENFNMTSAETSGTGNTSLVFGSNSNDISDQYGLAKLDIDNLTFKSATGADTGTAKVTAYVVNGAVGSENFNIGALSVESGANVDMTIYANTRANSVNIASGSTLKLLMNDWWKKSGGVEVDRAKTTFSVVNNFTSAAKALDFSGGSTIAVGGNFLTSAASAEINLSAGSSLTVNGNFTDTGSATVKLAGGSNFWVKGDFATSGTFSFHYTSGTGNTVSIDGAMNVSGVLYLDANGATATPKNVSVGGLVGAGTSQSDNRISTSSGYTGALSTLILTGADTYIYRSRLHDFGRGDTAAAAALRAGKIGITKDGSGKQFLVGANYYRGDTVVNAGSLFMNADGVDNAVGEDKDGNATGSGLGIGAVILNGGEFGAVGNVDASGNITAVGLVKATSLTWSSDARITVFISGKDAGLIEVAGAVLKASTDIAGAKYTFNFDFLGELMMTDGISETYKIMSFEEVQTNFTESDFAYTTTNEQIQRATFKIEDDGLYVTFSDVIPEPAEYAALFGLIALFFAARRRRSAKK